MTARRAKSRMTVGNRSNGICCLTCENNGRRKPQHRRQLSKATKAREKRDFRSVLNDELS